LSFQQHLNISLDENLGFRTEVKKIEGELKQLSNEAQAKLAVKLDSGLKLAAGPFSYHIRRAKVKGRGRLNVEAFWRLDSNEHVDEEDVRLGVVLMVPKNREHPVNVVGELKAYHDFQLLSADLFKDWFSNFSDALKALFGAGIVIHKKRKWEDITRTAD
jgi:hypothetical protein